MAKRKRKEQAESAGFDYAMNQIQSDYFHDWVTDQLIEASKMDPEDVIPLETKADAQRIARNMLQQLEWDTKRDLGRQSIDYPEAWFRGFHRATEKSRDWLADELLEINKSIGRRASERVMRDAPTLTDMERRMLSGREGFGEEIGAPSGLVAQNLGLSTGQVTAMAKKLAARGLLEDTGYAMKYTKKYHWQYIDRPKGEGGMLTRPGASTVWRTTQAGHAAIGD
jgi:hypothetical protein